MTVTNVTATECREGKNITANGDYLFQVNGPQRTVGVFNTVYAHGTWGGATLTWKATPDGTETNAMAITGGAQTSNGFFSFQVKSRNGLILTVSGGTGINLTVYAL